MPIPVFVEFIAGTGGLAAGIGKATALMAGLKGESTASLASVGKVGVALSGAVAVGAGLVAVASIKMAGDFQQSMTQLVTTAGESRSNIDLVANGLLDLSGKVGISAQEMATAMYTAESAGFHGADGLNVMTAAAQGAAIEHADLGTVVDAVTTELHDYGLGSEQAANVTSQLISATGHSKVSFQEFTGALHSVTPIASAAGISIQDATGSLAAMTASGMSASQAADNLGATIKGLSNQTGPVRNELAALGLNAIDLSKNLGTTGVAGTMQQISDAIMNHMGPAGTTLLDSFNQSKIAAHDAATMFDALPPALQRVATAVKDGSMSYKDYRREAGGLGVEQRGVLEQWRTMQVNADGFSQALKSGSSDTQTYIQALAKATGTQDGMAVALQLTGHNAEKANQAISDIGATTSEANGDVKGFGETQGNVNQQMAQLHETISSLAIRFGTMLLPAVTKVAEGLRVFVNFIADHQWALVALASVIGVALIVAISALSVALWGLAANPVVLIIAAIIAAIVLLSIGIYELWTHWGEIWGWIKDITKVVADFFVNAWNHAFEAVSTALGDVGSFFTSVWSDITTFFSDTWQAISTTTMNVLGAIGSFFSDTWQAIVDVTMGAVNAVVDTLTSAWNSVWATVTSVFDAIGGFFAKWWPLLLAIFMPGVFAVLALWHSLHDTVQNVATTVWNSITSFISSVISTIANIAKSGFKLFEDYVVNPIKEVWATIVSVWNSIVAFLVGVFEQVVDKVVTTWNSVYDTISGAVQMVQDYVVGKFNDVVGFLGSVMDEMTSIVSSAWDTIVSFVQQGVSMMVGAVEAAGSATYRAVIQPLVDAYNFISGLVGQFYDIGAQIVNGIISGVEGAAGSLFSSLGNLASGALDAAKNAIGIHSPSRAFADEVGGPISEGIAVGIMASAHHVNAALNAVTQPQDFVVGNGIYGASSAQGGGQGGQGEIHVHFHAPVYGGPQGMQEVAQVVRTELLRTSNRNGGIVGLG